MCCPEGPRWHCWDTGRVPRASRWEWGCCTRPAETQRQPGCQRVPAEAQLLLPVPAERRLCGAVGFEALPRQRRGRAAQTPASLIALPHGRVGVNRTWEQKERRLSFPLFGMPFSCFLEYLRDHKFRALEDISSQRLHVQDTIM